MNFYVVHSSLLMISWSSSSKLMNSDPFVTPPSSPIPAPSTPPPNQRASAQCGYGSPSTPSPSQNSIMKMLGSPYLDRRHYSVVAGRHTGVYRSW